MNRLKVILGTSFNRFPYMCFPWIGKVYNRYKKELNEYNCLIDRKTWIFNRVYGIVDYAINNIPFYNEFYKAKGFDISQLKSFDDIKKIPIVRKTDLANTPLALRSNEEIPHCLTNTGGSTGNPLTFYKSPNHRIKEMAYYHAAWGCLMYKKHKLRFQFVGRSRQNGCIYDFKRNQIRASVYEPFENILDVISRTNELCPIEYLQGYPSVIYEFALFCIEHEAEFSTSKLRNTLKGVFLNSEYPNPQYKKTIESVFGVKIIASYGQTEGCSLAFDFGNGEYEVFQSYGFSEPVEFEDGIHLIATSYDNYASPIIRYDTNDIVDDIVSEDGILQRFTMNTGGRNGLYILDVNDKRISLTGLIFGKHHKLFDYCSQLQISQTEKGKATIYYVPKNIVQGKLDPVPLFDSADVEIEFEFKELVEPIKTPSGKVLLLIQENKQ